ncbi:MAG: hypothetical protein AB8U25_05940 [Rickettsiales endosymbiont of Dermacentor nuttalli]
MARLHQVRFIGEVLEKLENVNILLKAEEFANKIYYNTIEGRLYKICSLL